jgi:hypothetical protein
MTEEEQAIAAERALTGEPIYCDQCGELLPEDRDLKYFCRQWCADDYKEAVRENPERTFRLMRTQIAWNDSRYNRTWRTQRTAWV